MGDLASVAYTYTNGRLTQIERTADRSGSDVTQSYAIAYGAFGDQTSVSVGSTPLATYTRNVRTGDIERLTYGNGDYVDYIYDDLDRLYEVKYRGSGGGFLISPNTIIGTFILVAQNQMSSANLVAQVHTHPAAPEERHNDFPSYANNIYGGDRLACELFGFPEMYIIPYCRCDGTPPIIVYSDSSTWCQNHPY